MQVRMRFRLFLLAFVAAISFFASTLTKENLVILVVGLLTTIGLVRVLTHETRTAAKEIYPTLTELAEGHYAFKRRLAELRSGAEPRPPAPAPK